MTARHSVSASRRARGAAAPLIIAVIVVVAALLAAYFFYFKPKQAAAPAPGQASAQAAQTASQATSATTPNVASMSVGDLLKEARKAMQEQRLLAPAGNNAFEFYLSALQKDPNNQVAQDALRETFPFATPVAEQEINQRNFAEAQREIDLLSRADPSNYTLTILRSKLDAQRKLADREQQDQQRQQLAAQQSEQQKQAAATQQAAAAAQQTATAKPTPTAATPPPAPATPKPAAPAAQQVASVNREPQVTRQVPPRYPQEAARAGTQGWVDVEFMVTSQGTVVDAKVLDSQPRRLFDRAALEAVRQWRFQPALRAGVPTDSVLRQRIEFKLGGG